MLVQPANVAKLISSLGSLRSSFLPAGVRHRVAGTPQLGAFAAITPISALAEEFHRGHGGEDGGAVEQ